MELASEENKAFSLYERKPFSDVDEKLVPLWKCVKTDAACVCISFVIYYSYYCDIFISLTEY